MTDPGSIARLLRRGASRELWIDASGRSMMPSLEEGDRLRVDAIDHPPRVGEVWMYVDASGALVSHRVVARLRGTVRFVGDAASRLDAPVPADRVVGRVTVRQPVDLAADEAVPRSVAMVVRCVARTTKRRLRSALGGRSTAERNVNK